MEHPPEKRARMHSQVPCSKHKIATKNHQSRSTPNRAPGTSSQLPPSTSRLPRETGRARTRRGIERGGGSNPHRSIGICGWVVQARVQRARAHGARARAQECGCVMRAPVLGSQARRRARGMAAGCATRISVASAGVVARRASRGKPRLLTPPLTPRSSRLCRSAPSGVGQHQFRWVELRRSDRVSSNAAPYSAWCFGMAPSHSWHGFARHCCSATSLAM